MASGNPSTRLILGRVPRDQDDEVEDRDDEDYEDEDGDDEDYEDEEDYEDDDDEQEEQGEEVFDNVQSVMLPTPRPSRVSFSNTDTGPSGSSTHGAGGNSQDLAVVVEKNTIFESRARGGETTSSTDGEKVASQEGDLDRHEIDGLYCPICMEAWTNVGDHKICCLPCGHIYGFSCISQWLRQNRSSEKCPQCKKKCKLKDVRVLYASQLVVVDEGLQKKVRSLEGKCASLEKKDADWSKKEAEWQKREVDLCQQVYQLKERAGHLQSLLEATKSNLLRKTASEGFQGDAALGHDGDHGIQACQSGLTLQKDFQIDGARFFDMDVTSQIFVIARRLSGMGGKHVLTKISCLAPHAREDIQLPVSMKAVKDLRISPQGSLALVASMGKKLSVLNVESNNTLLTYDLQAAAWSCAWNLNCSHYIYAGLQNGMLLEFDIRQTRGPVESLTGLTSNPVHTVYSFQSDLEPQAGVRTLLTASSAGFCEWNLGGIGERLYLVPESKSQGVCISLAHCPEKNDIVASFRPKVDLSDDVTVSQSLLSPSTSLVGQAVQGSHILFKRSGICHYEKRACSLAYVNSIRLPKSTIVDQNDCNSLFVSGDEVTCDLALQELPSFMIVQQLKCQKNPIRDLKYKRLLHSGFLGCLTDDCLQLFCAKPL